MPVIITETELDPFNIQEKVTLRRMADYIYDQFNANVVDPALDDLTDVDVAAPSDGDALVYNAGTEVWEATNIGDGTLGGLSDVTPGSPLDYDVLVHYDGVWSAESPFNILTTNVTGAVNLGGDSYAGTFIRTTGAATLTVLADASWATTSNSPELYIMRGTTDAVSVVGDTGVTIRVASGYAATLRKRYSVALLKRIGTNEWVLSGDLTPTGDQSIIVACSDETTALTTGDGKVTFRMPYEFNVTQVRASVTTAPTGASIIIDIRDSGTSMFSTLLTIDAGEKTSTTAAVPAVINDPNLQDDAEIIIDLDQVGSTVAGAGLKVTFIGYRV